MLTEFHAQFPTLKTFESQNNHHDMSTGFSDVSDFTGGYNLLVHCVEMYRGPIDALPSALQVHVHGSLHLIMGRLRRERVGDGMVPNRYGRHIDGVHELMLPTTSMSACAPKTNWRVTVPSLYYITVLLGAGVANRWQCRRNVAI